MAKSKLINPLALCKILGILILIESIMMAVCLIASFAWNEPTQAYFIIPLVICTVVGAVLRILGTKAPATLNKREAYLIVSLTWVIFSAFGTIPLLIEGHCHDLASAFFESMSGFTTTGASVIPDVDDLPNSVLLWRSLTHWVGGLGIVFFTMTLLPITGHGEVKLFAAESTGLAQEKLHSKMKTTAAWIWSIYISFTIICCLALWACGMSFFDSVNHAMSTISTGGFSTHPNNVAFYNNSPILEYTLILFMFAGGMNFYILYTAAIKRTLSPFKNNSELKFYIVVILLVSGICALSLIFYSGYGVEKAIRTALFNCIAINTTTGFTTDNYQLWYQPVSLLIMFLMFAGANSGSTSAGLKSIRMLIIFKTIRVQFKRILHPNAIIPVQINKKPIHLDAERNVMSLLFWFFFIIILGAGALMCFGISAYDSCNISLASVCNIGTNFGHEYGPAEGLSKLPPIAKWICSFLMLAGRLEIFAILLPFTRSFWRRQ